jgi:excisionase family DNA binding protein
VVGREQDAERADQAAAPAEPAGVSIQEAARRLDVEQSTVRAWIKAGKLRATREAVPGGPGPGWRYRVHLDEALREGTLVRRPRTRENPTVPTAAERAADQALREELERHRRELAALLHAAQPPGATPGPPAAPGRAVVDELDRHERALRALLARQRRLADEQRARIAELERGVAAVAAKLAERAARRPGRPRAPAARAARRPPKPSPSEPRRPAHAGSCAHKYVFSWSRKYVFFAMPPGDGCPRVSLGDPRRRHPHARVPRRVCSPLDEPARGMTPQAGTTRSDHMEQRAGHTGPDIILANEPRAYREVIAGTLRALHPGLAIAVLEPAELLPRLGRARPVLVIYSKPEPAVALGAPASVQLYPDGAGHAVVNLAGQHTVVADFALDDLLALIGRLLPGHCQVKLDSCQRRPESGE